MYSTLIEGVTEVLSEADKHKIVNELLNSEKIWALVFEAMGIELLEGEIAELEFRKAFYRLKFDRVWNNEIQRIENEHSTIMGAILALAKPGNSKLLNEVDPLKLSNSPTEYSYEPDLPFLRDLSEELLLMLCQSFKAKHGS